MRIVSFLLFFVISLFGICQHFEHGIDSLSNTEWFVKPSFTPSADECLVRHTYVLNREKQILFLDCRDSTELRRETTIFPEECMAEYHTSLSAGEGTEIANKRFRSCTDTYFRKAENQMKSDTIYIDKNSSFLTDSHMDQNECYFATCSEMYDSTGTFRYAVFYYSIHELKNKCISGNNFRKKRFESWKNGKKDGEWVYYDCYGNETKREVYREGKRVRKKGN